MYDPEKGDPVTPCMYVFKVKIQSDGSIGKLKLRIVVRGDLYNKEMIGDNWDPKETMRTLKYFLSDADNHKARVNQIYFIGEFIQANVKHRVFFEVGHYIWIILPRLYQLFWKTIEAKEINAWND